MAQTSKVDFRFLLKVKDQLSHFYRTLALKHHRTFLQTWLYFIEKFLAFFFFLVLKQHCQDPDNSIGSTLLFFFFPAIVLRLGYLLLLFPHGELACFYPYKRITSQKDYFWIEILGSIYLEGLSTLQYPTYVLL